MRGEDRAVWKERVELWKRSGLTYAKFAAEHGLNESTLSHWKWKLSREDKTAAAGKKKACAEGQGKGMPMLELPLITVSDERVELELRQGHKVRLGWGFEAQALRTLLEVVQGLG